MYPTPNTIARRFLGGYALICLGAMSAACEPNTLGESDPWRLQQQQVFSAEVIKKTPKTCQEPTDDERYEMIDEIFRQDRGIPIEIAFALIYKESSGRHCKDGYIKFNGDGVVTDGGVGYCQLTPTLNSEQEVIDHATNNLDARVHLEACAALLDAKWDIANRRGSCLVSDTCVEKEILEEWAWPIAIFGPNAIVNPNGKSEYVREVIRLAQRPLDPRVKGVQISNPEDCVMGFKFHQPRPGIDGYSTAQMKANGCTLHLADGYQGFMTSTGYGLKITSGWGPGNRSTFHDTSRAVDIGIDGRNGIEGEVRQHGMPILCPFKSGCEVVAGTFSPNYQWVRFRRADGKPGFVGRGGWEVLHVAVVDNGDMCRDELLTTQRSFTKNYKELIGYTARTDETGYGFAAGGAGPHVHLARCKYDSDFDSASSCNGSAEPFALVFSREDAGQTKQVVYSSDALSQRRLGSGEVTGLRQVDHGQIDLPSNYTAAARDCCAPRCEDPGEDPCQGVGNGWWCAHELDPDLSASTTRIQCQNNRTATRETCSGSCLATSGENSRCEDKTPDQLPPPQLIFPPDGHQSSSSSPPPTCEWDAPEGATTCRIVMTRLLAHANDIKRELEPLSGCENRGTCILQAKLEGNNIQTYMPSPAIIQEGRDTYWFVRCAGNVGSGDWSEIRSFRLEPGDPDPPQMLCPDGDGNYCGDANGNDSDNLYACNDGTYTLAQQCANGCQQNGAGQNDACSPPPASCPSGNGDYCGDANGNDAGNLYSCINGVYMLAQQCSQGCESAPSGQNDYCVTAPSSCPSGNGNYCGDANGDDTSNLYTCNNGTYTLAQQCSNGCVSAPPGQNDYCAMAPASCPNGMGDYCGDENGDDAGNLYTCSNGAYTLKQQCANGCQQNGAGQNDTCAPLPASCSSGNGDYCGDANGNDISNLYTCSNGTYTLTQQCSNGCVSAPPGQNDYCATAPASCPSGNGDYCGDANGNDGGNLYSCSNGTYTLTQQCSHGCQQNGAGLNDTCSPPSSTCGDGTCDANEDASNCPADCQAIPECTGGPCCSPSGTYQPSTFPCALETDERYVCPDGESSGDDVYIEIEDRFCSGSSSFCDGAYRWSDPFHHESCSSNEACSQGQSSCQPIAPTCVEECRRDTPAYRDPTSSEVSHQNGQVIRLTTIDTSDCQRLKFRVDKPDGSDLGAGQYYLRVGSCVAHAVVRETVVLTQATSSFTVETDYRGSIGQDKIFCLTKREPPAPDDVEDAWFYSNIAQLEKVEVCQ